MANKQFIELNPDAAVDGTEVLAEQEAAGGLGSTKKITVDQVAARTLAGYAAALTPKTPIAGADKIVIQDSADTFAPKLALVSDLPAATPAAHAASHTTGADPMSGDALGVAFTPSNYTQSGDDLGAHLLGIDNALANPGAAGAYAPGGPSGDAHWVNPNPATIQDALDRIAAKLYLITSGDPIL